MATSFSADAIVTALTGPPATPGVLVVYAFGSVAEGRMHRESDVDVGVLLDRRVYATARERFEARLQLVTDLERKVGGRRVDLVVLNDAPPELGRRVATRGRLLYCADARAEHDFRRDVQLRAADLEPFLRRARRRKLDAIGR